MVIDRHKCSLCEEDFDDETQRDLHEAYEHKIICKCGEHRWNAMDFSRGKPVKCRWCCEEKTVKISKEDDVETRRVL